MDKVIVFGNGINWLDICYENVKDNIIYDNDRIPFKTKNKIINFIIRVHFSIRDRKKRIKLLPLREIWYKYAKFMKYVEKEDNLKIFVYDHNRIATDEKFIKWLRKKFKNVNVSYVFTNIVEKSGAKENDFVNKLNEVYDNVFAFDENDAQKYNFKYNYLIYEPKHIDEDEIKYDLFFVGNAKERLEKLYEAYFKAKELGLKTCFYINQVPEEKILKDTEIIFNERITYEKSLELLRKSRCMLDFLQEGSQGIVLRICEAIVWDKVIITDNQALKKELFYNPDAMKIITDINEITKEFIFRNVTYPQEDKNYFKFENMLKKI